MTISVKHRFTSAKADGTDNTLVKPSNWNDTHKIETDGAGGIVIGRDISGPGEMQELPLAYNPAGLWSFPGVTGGLVPPTGTTAQRPGAPANGTWRFNSDTNLPEVWIGSQWYSFVVGNPIPPGTILPFGGNAVPAGNYLACDGARYSRASFPALYSAIGLLWDTINDGSTFTVPYLIGRALSGYDPTGGILGFPAGVGARFGTAQYSIFLAQSQMPVHAHIAGEGAGNFWTSGGPYYQTSFGGGSWNMYQIGATDNRGGGGAIGINPFQPTAATFMMIKY